MSSPAGGSFTSSTFSWTANPTNPSGYTVTSRDLAGNTTTTPLTFVSDTTGPSGGALTVNGTAATGAGSTSSTTSTTFPIDSRANYTDSQSGLRSGGLTVQSETLSSGTCGAPGSGGPFTTPATITGTTQPSGIVAGYCYLYTLTGTDNVGNSSSVSTNVQVAKPPPTVTTYTGSNFRGSFRIAAGPDGAMWFTDDGADIGRITTSGAITFYSTGGGDSQGIAAGPDGALWFTNAGSGIGRITTP